MLTAKASVSKTIERQALTKTVWYNPMKKVLSVIGIKVTKSTFAEAVSKSVPIIGGVVSGGITYATFRPESRRLKNYLRCLTPATGIALSETEEQELATRVMEESKSELSKAMSAAADNVTQKAAEVGITSERAAEVAEAAKDKAGAAAKAASSGIRKGLGGLSSRFGKRRKTEAPAPGAENVADQLRMYKGLLDDGVITQEDFDAKKKELLGL